MRKQAHPASLASTFTLALHVSPSKFIATPTDGVFGAYRGNTYNNYNKVEKVKELLWW